MPKLDGRHCDRPSDFVQFIHRYNNDFFLPNKRINIIAALIRQVRKQALKGFQVSWVELCSVGTTNYRTWHMKC